MDFKEFKAQMEQDVRAALEDVSPDVRLQQEQISKLQGESYTALSVAPADRNVGVNINLTQLYEQMQAGVPYDAVLDEAVDLATNYLDAGVPSIDTGQITDYARAKPLLCVEIVGTARNADMLEKVPHTDIEDLSMVYRVQLGQDSRGIASVLVTNEMLESYGVAKEQLHADALESSEQNRPGFIRTMRSVMAETLRIPEEQMPPDIAPPMYVVSNEQRIQGAAAAFYPGLMEAAARELKGDFFLLPSSVHEVLLLPDDGTMTAAELNAMVKNVNQTEVRPSEQLSDSVYHYDAAARTFERGDAYEARRDEKLNAKESRPSVLKDLQDKKQDMDLKPRAAAHRAKTDPEL